MRFYTHIAFSVLIFIFLIKDYPIQDQYLFLAVMLFFSALPDIDYAGSTISKRTGFIGKTIAFISSHRGMFHSLIMAAAVFLIIYVFSIQLAFAALLGYLSHLFADMLTYAGIMPFYPFSKAKIKGFMKTGGIIESVLFIGILSVIAIILFF